MSAARHAQGGVALRNGRLLVLVRGGAPGPVTRPAADSPPAEPASGAVAPRGFDPLRRELLAFLLAVFAGSLGGMSTGLALAGTAADAARPELALAVGTTLTGAMHARLVHRQPLGALLPRMAVAVPLAYGIIAGVHRLLAG